MTKFKYIKNIYRDKANTFHQSWFEPVEYQDGWHFSGGSKHIKIKKKPKISKPTDIVFGSNDDLFEF